MFGGTGLRLDFPGFRLHAGSNVAVAMHSIVTPHALLLAALLMPAALAATPPPPRQAEPSPVAFTLIPPGPVAEQVDVEARVGVRNTTALPAVWDLRWYLDSVQPRRLFAQRQIQVAPGETATSIVPWAAAGHAGRHRLRLVAQSDSRTWRLAQPIRVESSKQRSTGRLAGAWVGLYHWSEQEGRLWNHDIQQMTEGQWRELVRAMHRVQMDLLVVGESFRNQMYVGQHTIERDGYQGRAFYPSRLYPGRMPIAARDPFEAILSEADRLDMHVFMPVGLYAWFDYTPASLAWHQQVATELWQLYGHHRSFYGWYVVEEIAGNLGENDARRQQIVDFFKGFRQHARRLAPDKPVLLASNCHGVPEAGDAYTQLLPHLDILCPFGFHRMPAGDLLGDEAARRLDRLCRAAGTHLWMDLEVFLFDPTGALYPRPIGGLVSDLRRFPDFETILCYQFPGLMTAPGMSRQLGGPDAVKLFLDYERFLKGRLETGLRVRTVNVGGERHRSEDTQ